MPLTTFLDGRNPSPLRGLAFLALSDIAVIERRSVSGDSGGGGTILWTAAGTAACRLDPLSATRATIKSPMLAGRINENASHMLTVPPDTSVQLTDRVQVGSRGTFEVLASLERTGGLTAKYEVVQVN